MVLSLKISYEMIKHMFWTLRCIENEWSSMRDRLRQICALWECIPQKAWIWQAISPNRHAPPLKKLTRHSGTSDNIKHKSDRVRFMTRTLAGVRKTSYLANIRSTIVFPPMARVPWTEIGSRKLKKNRPHILYQSNCTQQQKVHADNIGPDGMHCPLSSPVRVNPRFNFIRRQFVDAEWIRNNPRIKRLVLCHCYRQVHFILSWLERGGKKGELWQVCH